MLLKYGVQAGEATHSGSSSGGGPSLTISTRKPWTPMVAIWYESSLVSCEECKSGVLAHNWVFTNIDVWPRHQTLGGVSPLIVAKKMHPIPLHAKTHILPVHAS